MSANMRRRAIHHVYSKETSLAASACGPLTVHGEDESLFLYLALFIPLGSKRVFGFDTEANVYSK